MKVPFKIYNRPKALMAPEPAKNLAQGQAVAIELGLPLPADQISTQLNAVVGQMIQDRSQLKSRIKEVDSVIMPIVLRMQPKVKLKK